MLRTLQQQPQCQICFRHAETSKALQDLVEDFQLRLRSLLVKLQPCPWHSFPNTSREEEPHGLEHRIVATNGNPPSTEDSETTVNAQSDLCGGFLCPHSECHDKPKKRFTKRGNFVRHYTMHVACRETCSFCHLPINRVRTYVTHLDDCNTRKEQERLGVLPPKMKSEAMQLRQELIKIAAEQLDQHLATTMDVNGGEASAEVIREFRAKRSRKRRRADSQKENPQERYIVENTNVVYMVEQSGSSAHPAENAPLHPDGTPSMSSTKRIQEATGILSEIDTPRDSVLGGLERNYQAILPPGLNSRIDSCSTYATGYDPEAGRPTSVVGIQDWGLQFASGLLPRAPFASSYPMDDPFDGSLPLQASVSATDEPFSSATSARVAMGNTIQRDGHFVSGEISHVVP